MKKDRHITAHIPFRCSLDMEATISKIAAEQHTSKSAVLRKLVEQGLLYSGYQQDDGRLQMLITTAVKETLTPQVERLAAISAKATQISSAAFFMEVYLSRALLPPSQQQSIEELAGTARKLGIEYLKLKDRDIDTFLRTAAEQMKDDQGG